MHFYQQQQGLDHALAKVGGDEQNKKNKKNKARRLSSPDFRTYTPRHTSIPRTV